MMFSSAIAARIARYTHGLTPLRGIDGAWAASRDDDLHRSPLLKAAALLVARDALGPDSAPTYSVPVTPDRTNLLIGITSAVGLILLIALVSLLLWSRHRLRARRRLEEHVTDAEGNVPIDQEPKDRLSSLRPLLLPLQHWYAPASWGVQRRSMTLPIHAPPNLQPESTGLPIHAPLNDQRNSMKIPIQAPPRILVRPRTQSPSLPDSAYTPSTSLHASNHQHTPFHTHSYSQGTHRGHKNLQPIGAIVIRPPGLRTQRDPPPPYDQLSYLSLSG